MLDSRELLVEVAEQANLDDIYPPEVLGGAQLIGGISND